MPTLSAETLEQFANALFRAAGVAPDRAKLVATSLVEANLRGHDSHGVMRIPFYIGKIQEGAVRPDADLNIEQETPTSLVCDGQWGLGQTLTADLMRRLIEKCRAAPVAVATLKRAAHIGRLGEYAEQAAAAGLASIICCNTHGSGQRVAPVGAKRGRLGTNPICIGFPGGAEGPFVFDIGTSSTAEGKVRVKRIGGQECPPGWLLDADGCPTTDPNKLYADPPGSILPLGGDQAYKGFGLAFMIDLLAGALSGGNCAFPNPPAPMGNCSLFIVLNPRQFAGAEFVLKEAAQLEGYVRSAPLIDGVDRVMLPGDPERLTRARRLNEGISLDDGNWQALVDLAKKLNVPVPA